MLSFFDLHRKPSCGESMRTGLVEFQHPGPCPAIKSPQAVSKFAGRVCNI
jgi:hypothetical protein